MSGVAAPYVIIRFRCDADSRRPLLRKQDMATTLEQIESPALLVHMRPLFEMDDDTFAAFCRINRDLRIEMTADGDIILMPPTGGRTGNRNAKLTQQVANWTDTDNTGVSFASSTLFKLPDGAKRSPDVSWMRREKLQQLTDEQKDKFLPLCPDFVIELRSLSDSLTELQEKMREYIKNGVQLGWLIDPQQRQVFVYRADNSVERIDNPKAIAGEALLAGFTLDLLPVWEADF